MKETDLKVLQEEMVARLESDSFFSDVPVLLRRKGDIANDVANSLGTLNQRTGKTGAVAVVMMPSVDSPNVESPGPQIVLLPVIRVMEKPILNLGERGTGKTADAMALRTLRLFHLWRCDVLGATINIDRNPMRPANITDPASIGYDIYLTCQGGFEGTMIVPPRITVAGESVLLSCNTPGVEIWYTTDGSYPRPSNEAATKYASAISIPASGTVVRAGAYLGERIPSSITQLKIQ